MPIDESERSLSDGGTFAGQPKVDHDDVSLGGEATFAGSSKRRAPEMSLGDERTFGDRLDEQETVIDDIEIVDLAARYRTEGTLGRGGMGEVLLALDTRLDRKVAIKRILGEAARSKTAVSRFLTEAKAIAALNHPNVVQIYDYGRAKDGPFLIMEYVDGSSLLDRCRDGALPLDAAVDLACQLCDGLGKAHDLGIVHRDIKPANVLLTKDGLPKLTDFGLAKAEAADHQMTMTGAVLGTPDFMPPEQRQDAALVDHRSDLWSLAATVYQMVTGRSPKIIRFDLLPAGLTSVLGRALEESKDYRYQSAREFRDALKTSLAAAAPAAAELGAGQCPACGVKNDSSRRFCRGCGESLEATCLSCTKPMPIWEEICGQCGTKQGPLLEERRGEMAAKQAEAESLLKDYDFEHAEQITITLRDEADYRLKHLVPWATDFVSKISKARDAQLAQASERLAEALKHEASFDYPSAIHALELVPGILRRRIPDGNADSVQAALDRVSAKQTEVERLEAFIKSRIASRDLSGLLPEVRKLVDLRPDRADVKKVCSQLEDRQQKLVIQRDRAISLARSHLDSHDYESALAALSKVDESAATSDDDYVRYVRSEATSRLKRLKTLMQDISVATKRQQLDGLLEKVEEALQLKPGHGELLKLRENLHARFIKIHEQIFAAVDQASQLAVSCRFAEAASLLGKIPEPSRSDLIRADLQRYDALACARAAAAHAIKAATPGTYDEAREIANVYEVLLQPTGISDPEFSVAFQGLTETLASHLRTQRWILRFRNAAAATAVGAVVVVAGLWLRSPQRAEALLEPGRPNDTRNLVPTNASIRTSGPTEQMRPAEKTCLNGCLLVRVPEDFVSLSRQELESKYPGYSNATNPIEEWASRDGTLNVAVTAVRLSAIPGTPNNLTAVQEFMDSQLRRNPSCLVREWQTQTINGQEWRYVDLEATVDSKRCQQVAAMTVVNSRMLSVTFMAFSQQRDEWLPIRDEVFQSLKVTCP
jgi:serine/threonine protein kinase